MRGSYDVYVHSIQVYDTKHTINNVNTSPDYNLHVRHPPPRLTSLLCATSMCCFVRCRWGCPRQR